jgi:DNA-binding transcriptional LysR family regulator
MSRAKPRHYFKELRFRQLRAFCLVAHTGSFSAAADQLHISRPAIWNQVRSLETEFAATFVRVTGRRVQLTAEGQTMFDLAAPVVEAFEAIRDLFQERSTHTPRTLLIATTSSLLNNELQPPLRRFQERQPHVRLRFVEGPSRECVRRLEAGDVELAFFGHLGSSPIPPRLHVESIGRYPVVLVHRKDSALSHATRLDARELSKHSLILPAPDTSARHLLDAFFARAGVSGRLNISIEAQNAIQFADPPTLRLGALLTTISPLRLAQLQKKEGSLTARVIPTAGYEEIHCARRVGDRLPPIATDFLDLVLREAAPRGANIAPRKAAASG